MRVKKVISSILAVCTLAMMSIPCINAEENTVLTVDANNTVREITSRMYGLNFGWGASENNEIMLTGDGTDINPKYIQLFQDNLPLSRAGGMGANGFEWKKAIGDLEDRTAQETYTGQGTSVVRYGLTEWISGNYAADENAGFAYVVNLSDLDNLADLVRFLRLNPTDYGSVGTDGTNWAQKRVDLGVENPVPITIWELGNEVENQASQGGLGLSDPEDYASACQEAIEIIKGIDPDAKICVEIQVANNQYMGDDWDESWNEAVLEYLGDDIDYVSIHNYCNWENLSGAEMRFETMNAIVQNMSQELGKGIKVFVSEHSANPIDYHTWSASFDYMTPHTLGGTLATAEYFTKAFEYDCIDSMSYYASKSGPWAAIYYFNGKLYSTAPGTLLKILNGNFTGSLLESELVTNRDKLFAKAVKTDKGVNILLVNRETEAVTVDFSFNNAPHEGYDLVSESYISGEANTDDYFIWQNATHPDWADYDHREIQMAINQDTYVRNITSYEVAPLSVVVLNLEKSLPKHDATGVTSFKMQRTGSNQYYTYTINTIPAAHKSTMGTKFPELVGTYIEGNLVKADDQVLLKEITEKELGDYIQYGNGLRNVYTWKEKADCSGVELLWGGTFPQSFGKFYGYADGFSNFAARLNAQSNLPPRVYASKATTNAPNGFWTFRPGTDTKGTVTFGHYGLNLNGVSKITIEFSLSNNSANYNYGVNFGAFLTQGADGILKNSKKQLQLMTFDFARNTVIYNGSHDALNLNYSNGFDQGYDAYNKFEVYIDTTSDAPKAKTICYNTKGKVVAETGWYVLQESLNYDFTKDMGFKFHITPSAENKDDMFLLRDFTLTKSVNINGNICNSTVSLMNNADTAKNGTLVAAAYDKETGKLVGFNSVDIGDELEAGATINKDIDLETEECLNEYKLKYFFFDNLWNIEPLGIIDKNSTSPTIVCD